MLGKGAEAPRAPSGKRIFAVGDIHGRRDLLFELLEKITAYRADDSMQNVIVFVGDYVDRGPDSKGVIDTLITLTLPGWKKVFLRGNHDQALLDFLKDPMLYRLWRNYGAAETLLSYGVMPPRFDSPQAFESARDAFAAAISGAHLDFLNALNFVHEEGDYAFVHAGVRPGVALERQAPEDLLAIRDEFLLSNRSFGKVVVHGHTPSEKPIRKSNRIGLDTGAHATGCLTAAVLEGESCVFLKTGESELALN